MANSTTGLLAFFLLAGQKMNDKEKAGKYDKLVEKSGNGDDVIDIEGQKWLRMHPDVEEWANMNRDMIEWMTETTSKHRTPRSDCG